MHIHFRRVIFKIRIFKGQKPNSSNFCNKKAFERASVSDL